MDETKMTRALAWVGGGGTALAVSTLMAAGLFALTPEGQSPIAELTSCFSPNCAALSGDAAPGAAPVAAPVTHAGRVTHPPKKVGPAAPAPARTAAPAAPKPVVWSTSLPQQHLAAPIVAAATPNGTSLVMAGADGGVFPIGQGRFFGSLSARNFFNRVVAVTADPSTGGYWLASQDGGVFAFHAAYHGSLSAHRLASPVVAMAATPTGHGYWLVSQDGGVFAFGDAVYHGSLSAHRLASPVVGMAATPTGHGYWLVSQDGGVFAFGNAAYHGASSGNALAAGISSIVPTSTGHGYWVTARSGAVSAFGDAHPVVTTPAAAPAVTTASLGPADLGPVAAPSPRPAPAGAAASRPARPQGAKVFGRVEAYKPGSTGMDISQYQCGNIPAAPAGIAAVQVTGGAIDNAPNPCYVQEAQWAGPNVSTYIYMNGLPRVAPAISLSGPAGHCDPSNIACASYNYGYNYARHWVSYSQAAGVDSRLWWIDVERDSGWQDTVSNQLVIRGALGGLKSMHVKSGVYSTTTQWQEITGGMAIRGEPEWTAGAGNLAGPGYSATSFCAAPRTYSFGGGRLTIVQYGYEGPFPGSYSGPATGYDLDLAC